MEHLKCCKLQKVLVVLVLLLISDVHAMEEGRIIQVLDDVIGAENFTFYRLQRPGMLSLKLESLQGDVDMYLSTEVQHPDYYTYDLKSDSCGTDIIIVPTSTQRPAFVGLFGHPNHVLSKYRLTISELEEEFVEDYEYLVNKYEKYYFEEMESEMTGAPKPQGQGHESAHNHPGMVADEEESMPMWWNILVEILKFGIEVVL